MNLRCRHLVADVAESLSALQTAAAVSVDLLAGAVDRQRCARRTDVVAGDWVEARRTHRRLDHVDVDQHDQYGGTEQHLQ